VSVNFVILFVWQVTQAAVEGVCGSQTVFYRRT